MKSKIKSFLDKLHWLPTLKSMETYARLHDDHDGTFEGVLLVTFGQDGDAHITTTESGLRFRTFMGGGRSKYTRMALMVLAEAIRLDNEENPQQTRPSEKGER